MTGIGIIGSGFMGLTYSEALKHIKNARLIAIAGGSRCAQLAKDYKVPAESVDGLLAHKYVQGVIIATPDQHHKELTLKAAAAGKHVLVEKPMAPTVADCNQMIEGCLCHNTILAVVKTERFRKITQIAKQMNLGPIYMVRTLSSFPITTTRQIMPPNSWMRDPNCGGLFMGMASHNADFLRWITGAEVTKVYAQANTYSDLGVPAQSVMAQLTFDNGIMGQMWISSELPKPGLPDSEVRFEVVGQDGIIDLENFKRLDAGRNGIWERVYTPEQFDYLKEPKSPIRLYPHIGVVQEFVNSIQENRPPLVSGLDGRAAVEICEACLTSARTGQVVTLVYYEQ